jgi:methylated-DNA-[protein]-cysteine S-methyltransferase
MKTLQHEIIESPIGNVLIVIDDGKLCALDFEDFAGRMRELLTRHYGEYQLVKSVAQSDIAKRVSAYFQGD